MIFGPPIKPRTKKKPYANFAAEFHIFSLDLLSEAERLEVVAQVAHDNSTVLWIGCGAEVAEGSRFGRETGQNLGPGFYFFVF
jgi:hypothetical protein